MVFDEVLPAIEYTAYTLGWRHAPRAVAALEVVGHAVRNRPVRVALHQGVVPGIGTLRVRVVGWDASFAGYLPTLVTTTATEVVSREESGMRSRALSVSGADYDEDDVTFVEVPQWRAEPFLASGWFMLPKRVAHVENLSAPESRLARRIRRNAQARGLRWDVSQHAQDLERFYREMYLPSVRRHHGDLGKPTPLSVLRLLQHGGSLLRVLEFDRWIASALMAPNAFDRNRVSIAVIGAAEGYDEEVFRAAPVLFARELAKSSGYRYCDHLGSAPFLRDGIFRRKQRWGARLEDMSHRRDRVMLRVAKTAAAARFVEDHPFLALERDRLVEVHRMEHAT